MIRLILLTFLGLTQMAMAQDQSVEMRDLLRSIHLDPAFRQNLRERGYTGERFEVMIDHTRKLYADKVIVGGLQRRIEAGLRAAGNKPDRAFFAQLDRTLSDAYDVGLTRLSNAERRRLFSIDHGFLRAIPARDCTRALTGKLSPARGERLFDSYFVQLSPQRIADYQGLIRKATRLGLAKNAKHRTLSGTEIRRAEEAIFPQIDTMIGQQKNANALYRAWAKGPAGIQRYACTFTQMFGNAALALRGNTGDLAILYLITQ